MSRSATPDASATRASTTSLTRGLLACGVVAGPVFAVVAAAQVLSRDGFVLSFWPSLDGISVRLAVAVTLAFAFVSVIAARLMAQVRS